MELTLISFATLLLLFSGAGLQARSSEPPSSHVARVRQLFASCDAAEAYALWAPGSAPAHFAGFHWHHSESSVQLPAGHAGRDGSLIAQTLPSNVPASQRRKRYRTRFGFADGAYRAQGPPLSGPSLHLDRVGS